jgi:hypothetical protein
MCASHIAHTHKQIDTAPCPKFHRKVVPGGSRCSPGTCPAKKDRFYTFETIGESLFEHIEKVDRQWREERFRREEERLAREERIKEESGSGQQRELRGNIARRERAVSRWRRMRTFLSRLSTRTLFTVIWKMKMRMVCESEHWLLRGFLCLICVIIENS